MSDLHSVGPVVTDSNAVESVHPKFIKAAILRARKKSWEGYEKIREKIKVGMTEEEARLIAKAVLEKMGSTKHWHKPYIRFGPGTQLTFRQRLQPDYRLQKNDPVFIDIGPVWRDEQTGLDYEGDVGDTFVIGENKKAEKCAATARKLWKEAKALWKRDSLSGKDLYAFMKKRAHELGYQFIDTVDGHRLADYPHMKYSKRRLADLSTPPKTSLWVLELQINHPTVPVGAFFEDLLT